MTLIWAIFLTSSNHFKLIRKVIDENGTVKGVLIYFYLLDLFLNLTPKIKIDRWHGRFKIMLFLAMMFMMISCNDANALMRYC